MISVTPKSSYCWVFPTILTLELRLLSLKFIPADKANAEVGFSYCCCLNSKSHQVPHLGDCKKRLDTFQFLASHFFLPTRVCGQLLQLYPILCDPMTVARQPPLSMGVSRQESWSGVPCPPPGDRLHPGTESTSPVFPALQADFSLLSCRGNPFLVHTESQTLFFKNKYLGSWQVQWLRFPASNTGDAGLILGQRTKISHAHCTVQLKKNHPNATYYYYYFGHSNWHEGS